MIDSWTKCWVEFEIMIFIPFQKGFEIWLGWDTFDMWKELNQT